MCSSYCGSVIGPNTSSCTLPRMFMPAPCITRTFIVRPSRAAAVGPAVRLLELDVRHFQLTVRTGFAEHDDGLRIEFVAVLDIERPGSVGPPDLVRRAALDGLRLADQLRHLGLGFVFYARGEIIAVQQLGTTGENQTSSYTSYDRSKHRFSPYSPQCEASL